MAFSHFILLPVFLQLGIALASGSTDRNGHGLIGYGITMYKPACAFACRDSISGAILACSEEDMGAMDDGMMMMSMGAMTTSPEC
jgi:hypothetical protein